jgi:hypothetical protein
MQRNNVELKVNRDVFDRRDGHHVAPPYLTDEGFVLIDRRAAPERRIDQRAGVVVNMDSAIKTVID